MAGLTSIAIGLGAAGLIGGAIAGGSDKTQTTQNNVAPAGMAERQAQQASWDNYLKQQAMVDQQGYDVQSGQPLQQTSRDQLMNVIGGQSFQMTPEEQQQIASIRDANVKAGQGDIQQYLNQNLSQISAGAADRGVRGGALSQLQAGALDTSTRNYAQLVNQANALAQQQSLDTPYRRAQLQGNLANQNSNFMEQLRQNAINNRQMLQNPVLLGNQQNERLASATQTTTQPGSLAGAIGGAFGGAGSGLAAAGGLAQGSAALRKTGTSDVF